MTSFDELAKNKSKKKTIMWFEEMTDQKNLDTSVSSVDSDDVKSPQNNNLDVSYGQAGRFEMVLNELSMTVEHQTVDAQRKADQETRELWFWLGGMEKHQALTEHFAQRSLSVVERGGEIGQSDDEQLDGEKILFSSHQEKKETDDLEFYDAATHDSAAESESDMESLVSEQVPKQQVEQQNQLPGCDEIVEEEEIEVGNVEEDVEEKVTEEEEGVQETPETEVEQALGSEDPALDSRIEEKLEDVANTTLRLAEGLEKRDTAVILHLLDAMSKVLKNHEFIAQLVAPTLKAVDTLMGKEDFVRTSALALRTMADVVEESKFLRKSIKHASELFENEAMTRAVNNTLKLAGSIAENETLQKIMAKKKVQKAQAKLLDASMYLLRDPRVQKLGKHTHSILGSRPVKSVATTLAGSPAIQSAAVGLTNAGLTVASNSFVQNVAKSSADVTFSIVKSRPIKYSIKTTGKAALSFLGFMSSMPSYVFGEPTVEALEKEFQEFQETAQHEIKQLDAEMAGFSDEIEKLEALLRPLQVELDNRKLRKKQLEREIELKRENIGKMKNVDSQPQSEVELEMKPNASTIDPPLVTA